MSNGYVKSVSTDPIAINFPFGATLGRASGHTRVAVYGFNGAPAAGADVWVGQGAYPFQTSAQALEIISSSANDAAAGTGARTVMVQGLDANFNPIQRQVATGTMIASQTALTTRITGITSTPPSAYAGFEGILVANQYLQ
ncbi:hypothetical protein LGM71_19215 [Burkholderia sp. AU33545]|uniref:hypothetical protein n=1 Tax=Burkholderia sp. AU33545 TaxID=2879631 RepID=UPI001CF2AA08|nr:hypothetical protein [Burkholderia sp. AU33545]MCA8203185.1 hypothetical protein [Burkholderia sp. AU33545]